MEWYCTSRVALGVWGGWGGGAPRKSDSSGGWVALGIWREGSVGSIEGGGLFHRLVSSRISKCPEHVLGQQVGRSLFLARGYLL